jgi:gliding motility-associated-like protein
MRNKLYNVSLSFFLFLTIKISYAQNQTDNWYFGNKAALNFSTCNPTVVNGSQINTLEGCATISDVNGNLLFYTDGIKVWNKLNLVMQNGTGLFGHTSSTQSGVMIPQPGNDSIYYIFTIDDQAGNKGLCYSIVNINHNAGLGEVILKNINILTSANEKITAVRHFNKQDIWVLTRQCMSDKYYAWLVTAGGVSASPVISTSPNFLGPPVPASRGYLKPSTDGKKIVCAFDESLFMEISDFNNQTGTISNTIKINSKPSPLLGFGIWGTYGAEFSANNKFLYVRHMQIYSNPCPTCPSYNYYIYQFNVTTFDSVFIANSAVLIDSGGTVVNPSRNDYGSLQLAKNGKIYIAQWGSNKLSVINKPDVSGTACNFQIDAVDLGTGLSQYGLPTFIQSYFDPNFRVYDYSYSEDCNKNVSFTLNTAFVYDSLRWNFDDPSSGGNNVSTLPNPMHSYSSNGMRNVQLYVFNRYGCIDKIDTITKQISVGNKYFTLGIDTSICAGDTLLLNATAVGATAYSWSIGAITPSIKVTLPGIYWCDVTVLGCTYRDSLNFLGYKPYPIVNLGIDTTICEDDTHLLNATNLNSTYIWQDGSTQPTYQVTQKGTYDVRVNMGGCIMKDTINIDYKLKPRFTLGQDLQLCLGNTYILKPGFTNAVSLQNLNYLWQDGSVNPTLSINQHGTYRLEISNSCGFTSDEIEITKGICELYVPNAFTPDGNLKNDVFKPGYIDNLFDFQLQVFNRYGQLIFNTNDRNEGWDGKVSGRIQPAGTYTWRIQYRTAATGLKQEMQGTVILLR